MSVTDLFSKNPAKAKSSMVLLWSLALFMLLSGCGKTFEGAYEGTQRVPGADPKKEAYMGYVKVILNRDKTFKFHRMTLVTEGHYRVEGDVIILTLERSLGKPLVEKSEARLYIQPNDTFTLEDQYSHVSSIPIVLKRTNDYTLPGERKP
jgi:hypothetical protein